jgi:hypothetical protein
MSVLGDNFRNDWNDHNFAILETINAGFYGAEQHS